MDETDGGPPEGGSSPEPSDTRANTQPSGEGQPARAEGQPHEFDPNLRRPRRRGRRGRGPGAPFPRPQGQPFHGGRPPQQGFRVPQQGFRPPQQGFRPPPRGPQGPRPAQDDDESSQLREIGAYERRQQQQQRRTGWRPPTSGGAGWRAPAPQAGPGGAGWRGGPGARPGGGRGRPFGGGAAYSEQIRRATGGPRTAAPSHEAGEPLAGPHAVLEAIRSGRAIRKLYVSQDRSTRTGPVNDLIAEAQQRRIFVNFVDKLEIARLAPIENHQGVVAIVEGRAGVELEELLLHLDGVSDPPLVLALDSLQDPQNFGVLLRSAEGAGVDGVVIPRHRAVGLTAAVARTSAGASEHLLVAEAANLRQAIDALKEKGIWVVGADESGDLLYDEVDYRGPTAIVIGGEGEGIRRLVLEGCDQVVRIPMAGQVSSLNAAAAGTVVLYEALRQRRRDVAPPDTRTPRPAAAEPAAETAIDREAESEQREDEELHAPSEAAEAEQQEGEGGERGGSLESHGPDDEIRGDDENVEEFAEAAAADPAAPKPRAKKPAKKPAARKTTTRKKPAGD